MSINYYTSLKCERSYIYNIGTLRTYIPVTQVNITIQYLKYDLRILMLYNIIIITIILSRYAPTINRLRMCDFRHVYIYYDVTCSVLSQSCTRVIINWEKNM